MKKILIYLLVFVYAAVILGSTVLPVVTTAEEAKNTNTTEETTPEQEAPSEGEEGTETEPTVNTPVPAAAKCCVTSLKNDEDPPVSHGRISFFSFNLLTDYLQRIII